MHLPTSPLAQPVTAEDEDRSEAIKLATWVLLGVTVAVFISRQIMKAIVFRKVALDDFFILAATVFAIGLFVTYTILASEGLGVQGILTVERANSLMKGYYASEFLYILSICFSKLSLLVLFYTIVAVQRVHRRLVVGFGGFVLVWSIASLIVVAFQCELPRPWEIMTLRCFNTRAFWIVYCITDLSTEISIIMLSVNLVAYLQVRLSRKFAVVACFAPRALVASASIIRLVWLYPITPYSNPEYQLWLSAILSQMHVCLSICTACIPYMVPFFKSLEGSLRRTNSSKGPEFRMDERSRHTPSSLWFRRQKKSQTFNSWESTAVPSLQYERVPQASPYIPTPRAMSPLTPPHFNSRPGSTRSAASSRRGLSINIPDRHSPLPQSTDIVSPQTASSFALSPSCASPVPLLNMQSFIPSRKAPTPPAKAHSPYPPTSSSHYSSRSNSPASPPRPQRFSLFPQQSPPTLRYSPEMQQSGFTPVHVPPIRALRSQVTRTPTILRPYNSMESNTQSRMRSASAASPPKFSTAPLLLTPPPLTTTSLPSRNKHRSAQDLSSPMGTAIDHYFNTAAPETALPPVAPIPPAAPFSAQRHRRQKVLEPSNTLRVQQQQQYVARPEPPSRDVEMGDEVGFARDSIVMTKMARAQTMPVMRDVRSSPRLVVRDLA